MCPSQSVPPNDILSSSTNPPVVVDSLVPVSRVYHAAALLPKEAALVRSFAARLQQNLGFLEHGPHTAAGARLRDGGARPRHGPEDGGSAAAGAGHGEEERVAQCGSLHAVPSLQCSEDQLLQGGEDSEDREDREDSLHHQHPSLALAQLDMDTLTAAPSTPS